MSVPTDRRTSAKLASVTLLDPLQRANPEGTWPDPATVAQAASDLSWLCKDAGLFVALRRSDGPSALELDSLAVSARTLASFMSALKTSRDTDGDLSLHLLPMAHAWHAVAEETPGLVDLVDMVPAVVDLVFAGDVAEQASPESALLKDAASRLSEHAQRL